MKVSNLYQFHIPPIKWVRVGILFCMILSLASCRQKVEHGGKHPLVQVGNEFLYQEDLEQALPYGVSGSDSVKFAQEFVQKWVEEQLLYEKAKRNVRGDERIERMVEEYHRSLVMNHYELRLLQQKISEELPEEDLQRYYEDNKQLFILEESVIKGVFIKAPLASPGLKELKKWYKENSDEALEQLEKHAFRHAIIYESFYEHWMPVSELEGKVIVNLAEISENFDNQRDIEVKDKEYCYLLHIEEFVAKGEVKPYDLARHEIIDLLANYRKVELMNKVKQDLYNESMEMGRIKYYGNETMQTMGDTLRYADNSNAAGGTR